MGTGCSCCETTTYEVVLKKEKLHELKRSKQQHLPSLTETTTLTISEPHDSRSSVRITKPQVLPATGVGVFDVATFVPVTYVTTSGNNHGCSAQMVSLHFRELHLMGNNLQHDDNHQSIQDAADNRGTDDLFARSPADSFDAY